MGRRRRPEDGPFLRAMLRAAALARRPLEWSGVNYPQFAEILEWKLRLDLRRSQRTTGEGSFTVGRTGQRGLVLSSLTGLLIGVVIGLLAWTGDHPFLFMTVAQGMTLVMVGMVLLGDFSVVLLDTTDLAVLGPRPVSDRTVFAARMAHIVLYLTVITGSMSAGPILFGSFAYPPATFVPVYLLSAVLTSVVAVFGAVSLYLIALRFSSGERVKDFVVYFQIFATVAMVALYQLVPHLMSLAGERFDAFVDRAPLVLFAFPPCYTAGLLDLALGEATTLNALLAVCALAVPAGLLYAVMRLARRGFLTGLAALESESAVASRPRGGYTAACRRLLARSQAERGGFDFLARLIRRERLYKLRAYPGLLMVAVLGVFLGLRQRDPAWLSIVVYYAALMIPNVVLLSRYSETPDAAWIFSAAPFTDRRGFLAGAWKALVACLVVPFIVLLFVFTVALGGPSMLPHAALASTAVLALGLGTILVLGRFLPFSRPYKSSETMSGCSTIAIMAIVVGLVAGAHYLVAQVRFGVVVMWAVVAAVSVVLYSRLSRLAPTECQGRRTR